MAYPRLALSLALLAACTDGPDPKTTNDPTLVSLTQNPSMSETSAASDDSTAATTTPTSGLEPTTAADGSGVATTDPASSDATSSTTAVDPTTDTATTTTDDSGGLAECEVNADCASQACLKFRDFDPQAVCTAAPGGGNTRFPGTVLDLVADAPVAAAEVRVVGILGALTDPQNAQAVVIAGADGKGVFDATSAAPVSEGIGVVGIVEGGKFFLTLTPLASPMGPDYGPMSPRHDVFAVPSATLTAWSALLMKDPALADALPLGSKGGVVGIVRDATSQPVAGAVVLPTNKPSTAEIRYLGDDANSFNAAMTGVSGLFVIVKPALAEKFAVAGAPEAVGTAASTQDGIFVMALDLP